MWPKASGGFSKVDYRGHQVSIEKIEAHRKDLRLIVNVPFPRTLITMQSFLESLNYYSRFIEGFAIYTTVLYELREADFNEISRDKTVQLSISETAPDRDRDSRDGCKRIPDSKTGAIWTKTLGAFRISEHRRL